MKLRRRDVVKELLRERNDLLVVAGLGSTTWDITAAGDTDLNFPMWGAMGQAAMMGLGLALAQPKRRVLVVTGDGEMLMGLGALATIGVQRPPNLALAVFDNARYAETGMQASHTDHGVSLCGVARSCGIEGVFDITDNAALHLHTARGHTAPRQLHEPGWYRLPIGGEMGDTAASGAGAPALAEEPGLGPRRAK